MEKFESLEALERFEFRWKIVFTCFGLVLAGALLDYMLRTPRGQEAVWCYSAGALGFIGALLSAYRLRDGARIDGVLDSLDLLGEDLSLGDLSD
ncbi:hypothetical protein GM658_10790 [Pseudoduganella eburnea]|uniref:YiaAB two helix domain-containing protein n=1 Tax=Massilia eburnea TaxID=1776165 RepID=A0A6L6QFU3_9BURK|nr:hypothetical protein [Massilia eburnea]MTW11089.1 hypothetical protein [Massilia eburnea]